MGTAAIYRYQEVKREQSNLPLHELRLFKTNNNDNNTAHHLRSSSSSSYDETKKKVIVIGGGVVGITAAYKLALKGHSVALLEPRAKPGKECSACAAGGMQRSNPIVDRGTWIAVAKSFLPSFSFPRFVLGGGSRSGSTDDDDDVDDDVGESYKFFHIDWLSAITDPFFLRWMTTFTKTSLLPCSEQQYLQKEMLSFTNYAVQNMVDMMEDEKDPMAQRSGYNPSGSLSLSYDPPIKKEGESSPSTDTNVRTVKKKVANNNPVTAGKTFEPSKRLDGKDITLHEPSILHQRRQPTTAKFEYESRAASSERFTEELAERCANDPSLDVTFFYNTRVRGASTTSSNNGSSDDGTKRRVTRLQTNRGVIDVPMGAQVLVAAGAWTPHVMSLLDLYAPVYPLKGYAMSVSAAKVLSSSSSSSPLSSLSNSNGEATTAIEPRDLPTRIVSDKYMYTSRLGDEIRITSIGEFSGWCTRPTLGVEREFRREAIRQFPQLESFIKEAKIKCGHRPYVSDGILLLGRVDAFDNLLVSW